MLTGLELMFMGVTQSYLGLFSTPGFLVSLSDLSMSSIFGLRSSYMLEYCAAERKKELIAFATAWMELERIMLNEISQVVRDKYYMISPLSGT